MIRNFTPHALNIFDQEGRALLVRLNSEGVARCATSTELVGYADDVPLFETTFGEVAGLPEAEKDTFFVVSLIVRQALPDRTDLASPGELLRDAQGQPTGCKGLAVNR